MKQKLMAIVAVVGVLGAGALFAMPSQAATTQLYTAQSCLPDGSVRLDFSWEGNDPAANQQWLDLSLFNNNWEWGTFLGAGPLAAGQSTLHWDGLIPNVTHYVRVNQLLAGGAWDPSPTFYFTTIACAPAAPESPPVPSDRTRVLAPVDDARVVSAGGGAYNLAVQAGLPSGCALMDGYNITYSGNEFVINVWNTLPTDSRPCTAIYGTYELQVPLGNLVPGQPYDIHVNNRLVSFTP